MLLLLVAVLGCSKDSSDSSTGTDNTTSLNTQVIDNVNAANGDISAAIDKSNKLHVAYFNFNTGIKYATNKSGAWVSAMLHAEDANTTLTSYNDIAVDAADYAHVVYTTSGLTFGSECCVYYATNKSGSWVKTKIDSAIADFSGVGIAVSSSGKVHIVYGGSGTYIAYVNNLSGAWSAPVTIGSYWASVRPRLALDSARNVYCTYEHGGEGTLHLQVISATGVLGSNTVVDGVLDSGLSTGWSPNIAVHNASNLKYISYWDYDNRVLKLYNAGTIITIDSCYNWPESGIALDDSGKVYVSYFDSNTMRLKYTTNKSGSWVKNILTPVTNSKYSDIAIEPNGKIHIVYSTPNTLSTIAL
jgi:hypothetical protein